MFVGDTKMSSERAPEGYTFANPPEEAILPMHSELETSKNCVKTFVLIIAM
jgi:hypothetical protein